jgi:hypothetical protein
MLDKSNFIYYKDEPLSDSILGITDNRIVEIPALIDQETANSMIQYFEDKAERWGDIAFYGSSGMGLSLSDPVLQNFRLPIDFFEKLRENFLSAVELVFDRNVRPNTFHAQKWNVGGFANPHSDNSDSHGEPNAFEINKYVAILYLNSSYDDGELYFPDHDIEFKPASCSLIIFPGGVENIHGVKTITGGTRYTLVSFWDFLEAEYSEERKQWWEDQISHVRVEQAKQREDWDNAKP